MLRTLTRLYTRWHSWNEPWPDVWPTDTRPTDVWSTGPFTHRHFADRTLADKSLGWQDDSPTRFFMSSLFSNDDSLDESYNRRLSLFDIDLWKENDRIENDLPGTNNSIEGWHHVFDNALASPIPLSGDLWPRSGRSKAITNFYCSKSLRDSPSARWRKFSKRWI